MKRYHVWLVNQEVWIIEVIMTGQWTLPKVTVGIPSFQREIQLSTTLDSIISQNCPKEIIVVDDCSEPRIKLSLPCVHLVRNTSNLGEAGSVNRLFMESNTDYLAVVSDDDPQPDTWLEPMLSAISEHPNYLVYYPRFSIISTDGAIREIPTFKFSRWRMQNLLQVQTFSGCVINIARLKQLGITSLRRDVSFPNDFIQWLDLSELGDFKYISSSMSYWWESPGQMSQYLQGEFRCSQYVMNVGSWQRQHFGNVRIYRLCILGLKAASFQFKPTSRNSILRFSDYMKAFVLIGKDQQVNIFTWISVGSLVGSVLFADKLLRRTLWNLEKIFSLEAIRQKSQTWFEI